MAGIETRTLDRESLFVFSEMTIDGADGPDRIKVRNLSARGMMAVSDGPVSLAQEAVVALPNMARVRGTIRWIQGHRFGIAFEQEIEPLLARQQVFFENREAPRYARAACFPKPHGSRFGEILPV